MIEILPPLADGSWWLVQCHRCREIVGEAVASQWEAERVADHHTRSHTNNAIPAGNDKMYMVEADRECYIWSEIENDWASVGK